MRRSRGFTLIEMLTVVALLAMVMGGVFTAMGAMQSGITALSAKQGLRIEVEHLLARLRDDLQYARWDATDTKLRRDNTVMDVTALVWVRNDSNEQVRYVFDLTTDQVRREASGVTVVLGSHLDTLTLTMPKDNYGVLDLKLALRDLDELGVVHVMERNLVQKIIEAQP